MSFETAGYQLLPVLPELVLVAGSMTLLMVGAYRGAQTTSLVTGLAVCLLVITGVIELLLPAGKLVTFGGSFIVDDEAAGERRQFATRQQQLQHAGEHQQADRKAGHEAGRLLAPIGP